MEVRTLKIKGISLDCYFTEEDNGVILKAVECTTSADNIMYMLSDEIINQIETKLCDDLEPQNHDSVDSLGLAGMFAPDNSPSIKF